MSEPLLGQQLRQAIQSLAQQASRRAREETGLRSAFESRRDDVREKFTQHEHRVQEVLDNSQAAAIQHYQQKTQSVEKHFTEHHEVTSANWGTARLKREEKYNLAKAKQHDEFKEAEWTIDAILEADKKVAKDDLATQQRQVGLAVQEIDAADHEIVKLLDGWQMTEHVEEFSPDAVEKQQPTRKMEALQKCVAVHEEIYQRMRRYVAPKLLKRFRLAALFAVLWLLSLIPGFFLMNEWYYWAGATFLAAVCIGCTMHFLLAMTLKSRVIQLGQRLKQNRANAHELQQQCLDEAAAQFHEQIRQAKIKHRTALNAAKQEYQAAAKKLKADVKQAMETLRAQYEPQLDALQKKRDLDLRLAEENYQKAMATAANRYDSDMEKAIEKRDGKLDKNQSQFESGWQSLVQNWRSALEQFTATVESLDEDCRKLFPEWPLYSQDDSAAPKTVPLGMRFGQLDIGLNHLENGIPGNDELAENLPRNRTLPALLDFPYRGSLMLKAGGPGRAKAVELLQAVMLRALLSLPPGKVRFTIIDPVGLGENFAAFAHLADYDDKLVTSRVWTEPGHIEKRLADLTEHIENVIQKYLRNQFETLEEYNAQAGEVAEPYRILVIAHFPVNINDEAAKRLLSIAQSGLRCGIQTFILVDTNLPLPDNFDLHDLERDSTVLQWQEDHFEWRDSVMGQFPLTLDTPPEAEQFTALLHLAGGRAKNAGRVEVPFAHIAPPPEQWWQSDSRSGIQVALGKAGATRKQLLDLGAGTAQHVLIAGKTGSGKSTLLHALIVQLALAYSPDQVELYLVDFKKGVEFKTYATHELPHARVVAIESEREFGLSVLKKLDEELKQRGEIFRELGVHDLATYRNDCDEPMPRILLVVDEFQEFFVEDDRIAQEASLLLDRLVRQGRAFGMHVLLGSQTLGGAYSLARSTIDQMAVRIALQCSEADGHLILNKDNSAARLLARPGEAIYNDANGLMEGNNLFQVVWMSDQQREQSLKQIQELARNNGAVQNNLIIFEGNAPALLPKNHQLQQLLQAGAWPENATTYAAWLGDSISIKDPTTVEFRRQSGSNLLIVGQHNEAALGIMVSALVSLGAAVPPRDNGMGDNHTPETPADFYVFCDVVGNEDAGRWFIQLRDTLPQRVNVIGWNDVDLAVAEIAVVVKQRIKDRTTDKPVFLCIHSLHQFRNLRRADDDFGFSRRGDNSPVAPSQHLADILRDGPSVGVFTIIWCDTLNNVQRFLDRQLMREFEMRVLFQMNANDSSNLIDSPVAAKLGLHRALFYTEGQGRLEKFRPYGLPPREWLDQVKQQLNRPAAVTELGRG